MLNIDSATGLALSLLATLWASDAAASPDDSVPPPDDKIVIDVVTVNGSGCPRNSAAVAVASDNTAFTVTYSGFTAQVGGSSDPTDIRKNCQLNLRVHIPQGFTYAIAEADYRGFAKLQPGAAALERANYYFQGMSPTTRRTHNFAGPSEDDWQTTDITEVSELVFKPCGEDRNFNINAELRVSAGSSDPSKTSFISMDSIDGSVSTKYHFAWKKCP